MELEYFNPWWKSGKVPAEFLGRKRRHFNEIKAYLDKRQIIIFTGLRRVGKTTLMYQVIDELLGSGISPYNILYFTFDEIRYDLSEIIRIYEAEVLKEDIKNKKIYIFLDEIQKLNDWQSKIKLLYDLNPGIKLFLSGSAQISMWRGTRESLAGRFFDFEIKTLDFDEYLEFKGIEIDRKRDRLFEREIKRHLSDFIRKGGFIEAIELDEHMLRKYIKESLLERVIFIDIPQTFRLAQPELLMRIVNIAASRPGIYLDYKNLANDLNIDQRTLAGYISYLEYALFLQKLYNYSPNLLTSEKKTKRLYLGNTAFTQALSPGVELPSILEQFFVNWLNARFFLRTPQKDEIDIIHVKEGKTIPVEIKIREKIGKKDLKPIFRFLDKQRLKYAIIITLDIETVFQDNGKTIEAVPYWRYWKIKSRIKKR